ncbi:hypothetical protein [Actinobacillus minor]|uniref:hypothetical protein n=1 Tax=Actinobacillus minor TaxID=51047 RepID=UPI0023EF65B2|nr:hypothetical protein [Actinobacillus minor]MDD6911317.1 hypothetical protein [Actinobacillus minor]MDY4713778.1 hypothetical protein [Actinobacillus minor]
MRQTMNPIATDNGRFKDGNPATGEYGTVVTAQHMNNVQDSLSSGPWISCRNFSVLYKANQKVIKRMS